MICRGCGADLPKGILTCTRCGADVAEVTISGVTEIPKASWYLPVTLLILAGAVIGGGLVFFIGLRSPPPEKSKDIALAPAPASRVASPDAGWLSGIDGLARALEAQPSNEAPLLLLFCGPRDSCKAADAVLAGAALEPLLQRVYKVRLDPGHSKEERALAQEYRATDLPAFVFLDRGDAEGLRLSATDADAFAGALSGAIATAAKALLSRGGEALAAQQQDRAMRSFEAALALAPDSAEAYHWRGLVFEAKSDLQRAASDFQAAVQRDPENLSALEHLGYAYLELGDTKDALATLDRLVDKAPDYAHGRAHHLRASARARAGDPDGAKEDMKRACALGTEAACAFAR